MAWVLHRGRWFLLDPGLAVIWSVDAAYVTEHGPGAVNAKGAALSRRWPPLPA